MTWLPLPTPVTVVAGGDTSSTLPGVPNPSVDLVLSPQPSWVEDTAQPQPTAPAYAQPSWPTNHAAAQAKPSKTIVNLRLRAKREGLPVCEIRRRSDTERARKLVGPDGKPLYVDAQGKVDVTRFLADRRNQHAVRYTPDGGLTYPGRVVDEAGGVRGDNNQLKRYYRNQRNREAAAEAEAGVDHEHMQSFSIDNV